MSKVYVKVTSECDAEGNITPLALYWEDGTRFDVDRVLDVRNAASLKAGGYGFRYQVRLSSDERHVYGKVRFLFMISVSSHIDGLWRARIVTLRSVTWMELVMI